MLAYIGIIQHYAPLLVGAIVLVGYLSLARAIMGGSK